ncbi:cation-transporting P-type ATPase [Nonomuraea sp. B19D2]|uniref:cation-transporting P-type ATPase n=1 Tax=Nonomuraea sp. B19D2 TaxID=3159561 RepID=UPI0032DB63BD
MLQYGRNELRPRVARSWPGTLGRHFTHPLALLLWVAAALLLIVGSLVVAGAVVLIIVLNAAFAFVQEIEAERAVEALAEYIPQRAKVVRDGSTREIDAAEPVPGPDGGDDAAERTGDQRDVGARPAWTVRSHASARTRPTRWLVAPPHAPLIPAADATGDPVVLAGNVGGEATWWTWMETAGRRSPE